MTVGATDIVLPGLATAHSHAFQRALRGRTHALASGSSFWSWRALMYRFAERLDPDAALALSEMAFQELARNGVTAVGEFHYVHHGQGGTPYDERTVMADAVIEAARRVGLRVTLLRVLYARAGFGRGVEGAQRRFSDPDVEIALADVDTLRARYAGDPMVHVGVAPHSVRAVPREWIARAAEYAQDHGLPLHMHVAEQAREIHECLAEHRRRPVELLADLGALDARFVAVHATHLRRHEARLLGDASALACLCRTTERDLGDGAPDVSALRAAGVRICMGVDSHAQSDPFEELRAIELDERIRTERRQVALDGARLLEAGSTHGYAAIGMDLGDDEVRLEGADLSLAGTGGSPDAVVFGASGRAVRAARAGGRPVRLEDTGVIRRYEEAVDRLLAG